MAVHLLLALVILFCDFSAFALNAFETKRDERKRRKAFKSLGFWKRMFLLPGYPLWRRAGHFWCLAVFSLNIVSQAVDWAFSNFSDTFLGSGVSYLTLFTLIATQAIATIQSFLYSSREQKATGRKVLLLLGAGMVLLAAGAACVLFFYAVIV